MRADTKRAGGVGSAERWGARVRAVVACIGVCRAQPRWLATPRQHTALRGGVRARSVRAAGPIVRFGPRRYGTCRRVAGGNGLCLTKHDRTVCTHLDIFSTVNPL